MALDRVFAGRQGLVIEQMLEAVRTAGHDPLTLTCDPTPPANDAAAAKAEATATVKKAHPASKKTVAKKSASKKVHKAKTTTAKKHPAAKAHTA